MRAENLRLEGTEEAEVLLFDLLHTARMHCVARFAAPAVLALLAWSCTSGAQPQRMISELEEAQVTEFQMRILTKDYVRRFAGAVENASSEIVSRTDDPKIHRTALLWMSNAIGACQSAMLKPDPVAAILDMWALTEQMARFLDAGPGQDLFGEWQAIAINASRSLEDDITNLAASVSGEQDVVMMQQTVERWVAEHPIEDLGFTRQYPRNLIEKFEGGQRLGAFAAVESLEERVAIYSQFLPLFVELLPKQVRWQSRLVIDDYVSRKEILSAEEDLDTIGRALQGVHQELDELPTLLSSQRDAAIEAVRNELDRLVVEIDVQRVATIESIDAQRIETLDVLRVERDIVLDAIEELRRKTLRELPSVVGESMQKMSPSVQALADRLFRRAAMLCGAIGAVLLLAVLVLQLTRRRGAAPRER